MAYLNNPRVQHFLNTVRSQCKKCNIKFTLSNGHQVNAGEGHRCLGFFQEPDHSEAYTILAQGQLRVAIGRRRTHEWLLTLVHEYIHFKQWMRDDPIFLCEDYNTMEEATEAEIPSVIAEFKLPIPKRIIKRETAKYLKKLHRHSKQRV